MSHKKARVPHALIQSKINAGIQDKIRHALSKQALAYEKTLREKHQEYKIELHEKTMQICNLTFSLDDCQTELIVAQNEAKAAAKTAQETEHKLRRTIQNLDAKITTNTEQAVKANREEVEQYFAKLVAPAAPSLLVDNWRDSWKWISTWCFALIAFFAAVDIPPEVLAVLPENVRSYIIAFTAFCGLLGRYLNQSRGYKDGGFTGHS